jgi:signal transduction histidine kinase
VRLLIGALGQPTPWGVWCAWTGLFRSSLFGTAPSRDPTFTGTKEGGAAQLKDTDHPFVSAAVFVIIAYLIRLGLSPVLGDRSPWLLFTVAIVVAAGRYGVRPGLLAIGLSFVLGLFAFVTGGGIASISPESLAGLVVFIATGAAMLVFAAHLKATQERTMRLQAELQQAHTQSAVGAMASTLAHELNQPLAAASNYIAACKRLVARLDGEQKQAVVSGLAESEAQIQRTGEIIRHARDMIRNTGAKREPASLKTMIDRVTSALQASGQCGGATIRTDIERDSDAVEVNPIQIEQVLMNLLRNACQAGAPVTGDHHLGPERGRMVHRRGPRSLGGHCGRKPEQPVFRRGAILSRRSRPRPVDQPDHHRESRRPHLGREQ